MAWQELGGANAGLAGPPPNSINANIHWLGTTNAAPLIIRTNNSGQPIGAQPPLDAHEAMRITPFEASPVTRRGRVGIWTNAPARALHVEDQIHTGGDEAGLSFGNRLDPATGGPSPFTDVPFNGERWVWRASEGIAHLWSNDNMISVTAAGNVGIGVANASQFLTQKLMLGSGNVLMPNANFGTDGNLYLGGITDTGQTGLRLFGGLVNGAIPAGFIDVRTTNPNDGLRIRVDTGFGGTERMRVTAGGRVGIGVPAIANPAETLHVAGGIYANNPGGDAVRGESTSSSGIGVQGDSSGGHWGVQGTSGISSAGAIGVYGVARVGVQGDATAPGTIGVLGRTTIVQPGAIAGRFDGDLEVVGGGNKNFRIDHPLDPENRYLLHTCVESSEMKNVYDGVAHLDEDGSAWVELPEWFEALNGNFRYQLTAVGGSGPDLHVAEEVSENRFKIAGGEEKMKVCWQLTGSRKDRAATAYPFEVEQEKSEEERGCYLDPSLYDAPEAQRIPILRTPTPGSF
jgi:hypothetical protein